MDLNQHTALVAKERPVKEKLTGYKIIGLTSALNPVAYW
jgi:hypothetical protein